MPYSKSNYPDRIKALPKHAQDIWVSTFNSAIKDNDEETANKIAWASVKKAGYVQNKDKWVKASESFYYLSEIPEINNNKIEIMREGNWEHPSYGDFQITSNTINSIIKNFKDKVRGIDISFDLEHGATSHKGEAVAWVKDLVKKGKSLIALVEWTEFGKKKVQEKSFKYFSPEFKFLYTDAETGKVYNNVLLGGGLTNRPFIKNMSPVMLSEDINIDLEGLVPCNPANITENKEEVNKSMNKKLLEILQLSEGSTEDAITNAIIKLNESASKLAETETKLSETETKLSETETKLNEAEAENIKLKAGKSDVEKTNIALSEKVEAIELKLKEADWNSIETKALSEGKLTKPMLETFKSQYMVAPEATAKIIDCLQPVVALNELGSSKGNTMEETKDDAVREFNEKVEEYSTKHDMSYTDALIEVKRANPELFEKARG